MLGGEDFDGHIVQLVHLPAHPEQYRKEGRAANPAGWGGVPMLPIVFNLSCGEDVDPERYLATNVTILHAYANGSISFNTPAIVISWQMRGACPTVTLLQEHDYSTRASLDSILDALWLNAIAARLCFLILVGWVVVTIMRFTRLTSPSARELFPFRRTDLIPGVLTKEDLLVTFQRESNVLYLLFLLDALCLVLLYLLGGGALGWLAMESVQAKAACMNDGQEAGKLWADGRRLCYSSCALHLLGWITVVAWLKLRNATNVDRSMRHTEWTQDERQTVAAAKASGYPEVAPSAAGENGGEGDGSANKLEVARRGSAVSYSSYGSTIGGNGVGPARHGRSIESGSYYSNSFAGSFDSRASAGP
jgi:hypothetical protein